MFVDACAIVSITSSEPSASAYRSALSKAERPCTSVLAAFEAILILARPDKFNLDYHPMERVVLEFMAARRIEFATPQSPAATLSAAISLAVQFGVGTRKLSSLDCFHYAYAKEFGEPLLSLVKLLKQTDLTILP